MKLNWHLIPYAAVAVILAGVCITLGLALWLGIRRAESESSSDTTTALSYVKYVRNMTAESGSAPKATFQPDEAVGIPRLIQPGLPSLPIDWELAYYADGSRWMMLVYFMDGSWLPKGKAKYHELLHSESATELIVNYDPTNGSQSEGAILILKDSTEGFEK